MFKYCLFDLDGTVTDSAPGILNSVLYALEKMGIREEDRGKLYAFVGPPLLESFQSMYGMDPEDAERAVAYYREYFRPKGIYENSVYEGIPELLSSLKKEGRKVVMVTSKPEESASEILSYFGLSGYFDALYGATMDESRSKKLDVLRFAVQDLGIRDLREAVMIGDRRYDVEAANALGIPSLGVLYGYGSEAELREAGAVYIADTVEDTAALLLKDS